jgi:hypothetical protein
MFLASASEPRVALINRLPVLQRLCPFGFRKDLNRKLPASHSAALRAATKGTSPQRRREKRGFALRTLPSLQPTP